MQLQQKTLVRVANWKFIPLPARVLPPMPCCLMDTPHSACGSEHLKTFGFTCVQSSASARSFAHAHKFSCPASKWPRGFLGHQSPPCHKFFCLLGGWCGLQSSLFRQTSSGAPHWRRSPAPTRSVPPTAWMPCNKYSQAQKVQ